MSSHRAFTRGRALAVLALLLTASGHAWGAGCNGNPNARVDPLNQTVPERTNGNPTLVTLDGTKSTPNNLDAYLWTYTGSTPAGLAVTLSNAASDKPTFIAPNVGPGGATLSFSLRVTCGNQTSTTTTVVNVTDVFVNAPPTASAFISPLDANEGQTVTLDGSGSSDPDGQAALTYAWTQISGSPTVTLANVSADGAVQSFVAPNLAQTTTLGFRLTVSDGFLASTTDKTVNIVFNNDPPIAALNCPVGGVLTVPEGGAVLFSSAGSFDPEGGALTYAWAQDAGLPNLGIGGTTTPTLSFTAPQLGYQQLGGTSITMSVTDPLGASASKACGLFITDVTPPVIVVPADIEAEATSAAGAAVTYSATAQDAVEDLLPVPLACVPPSGSTFALDATTPVTCSATDAAGNADSKGFNVTVVDTTAPTLNVPGDTAVEATSAAGAVGTYEATQVDLVDGTSPADCDPPSGSTFPLGDTTVTCSAVDAHGNAATDRTFVFSVMDTSPPTIDAMDDLADVEATGPDGAVVTYTAPATQDLVDGDGVASCEPASGATFPLGPTTITCTASDAAGNAATPETSSVKVVDTTPPTIAPHADIEDVEATSAAGAVVAYAAPTWSDLVDGTGEATCLPASGSTFALGTTTVSCNHTDNAGNAATTTTFTVEVVDTTPPVIVAHSNISGVEATGPDGAVVDYVAPLWTDAVDGSGSATCAPASGATFALGTTTVACNATDNAGNAAEETTFTITVVDTTPPAVDDVADIVGVEATGPNGAAVTFENPQWTDAVNGAGTATCLPASGSTFGLGNSTVTCSATDGANNTGTSSFTIEVVDTTAPSMTLPADITREATGPSGASVTFVASANDVVDGAVAVSCAPASGSTFGLGTTAVNCSASDTRGNTAHGSFHVTVEDTTAPTLSLPADITAEATGPSGAAVSFVATANDLVSGSVPVTCAPMSGSTFGLTTTTVHCSATDGAGNTGSGAFQVTVRDTTPPTIAPHADVTATATGDSKAIVHYTNPTATDLVDGTVGVSCTPASGTIFPVGSTVVNCSATDSAGNTNASSFNVIVSYAFAGFFAPVDNLPVVNTVQAGQSIPVKFSLGGDQGMAIFAAGYPKSTVMTCNGGTQDLLEETSTAGSSSLAYDPGTGRYHYVWKTEKAWSGTCRQLQLKFADGKVQVANFYFRK